MGVEVPERLRPWLTFGAFALVANCVVPVCLVFSPGISFLVQVCCTFEHLSMTARNFVYGYVSRGAHPFAQAFESTLAGF